MKSAVEKPTVDGWSSNYVRSHFPTLSRRISGYPLVYLDCAATSLRPASVIDAGCNFCRRHDGNPHRGMHALSHEATEVYEASRSKVAAWLDAPSPQSVVITRNATSAINMVARGMKHSLSPSDNLVITQMEHHANLIPWQQLSKETGAELRYIPVNKNGLLELDTLPSIIDHNTKIVSLCHVSNVLGTINPVSLVVKAAQNVGARIMVDAAQSVGHMVVSFSEMDVDYLVFSAHKCYGPAGLGFLIGKPDALENLEPTEYGGDMIEYVSFESSTWADIPHRFEAGTANAQAVASFPSSIDFIDELGIDDIRSHEELIVGYALERLALFPGLIVLGPDDVKDRGGLVSFHDAYVPPHDMATILDQKGIAVRAGHHCAQPLHRHFGIPASTRASFGVYTTKEDVDLLIEGIHDARKLFGI